MSGPVKTIILLLSIIIGIFIPQLHEFSLLIKYFLMGMLFFAFLDTDFSVEIISIKHLYIFLYLIFLSITLYLITNLFNHFLALGLFISAIAPTAITSIPIMGYLKRNVGFATFSVLSTNLSIALILPFILPFLTDIAEGLTFYDLIFPVFSVIFIPLIAAVIIKKFFKRLHKFFKTFETISFFLFTGNIFLAMSNAGNYLRTQFNYSFDILYYMAVCTAFLTALNFAAGWFIGKRNFADETSISIGQKNTMFAIWVSITFINPVIALAPMMYTIFHNLFISYRLYSTK